MAKAKAEILFVFWGNKIYSRLKKISQSQSRNPSSNKADCQSTVRLDKLKIILKYKD